MKPASPFDSVDLHLNREEGTVLGHCGNGIVDRIEDSCFEGLQRKFDCSVRTSPNSICHKALPSAFRLSVNLSLPFEHLRGLTWMGKHFLNMEHSRSKHGGLVGEELPSEKTFSTAETEFTPFPFFFLPPLT